MTRPPRKHPSGPPKPAPTGSPRDHGSSTRPRVQSPGRRVPQSPSPPAPEPPSEGWHGWDDYAAFYDWENARTLGRRDVSFWRGVARRYGRTLELGSGT